MHVKSFFSLIEVIVVIVLISIIFVVSGSYTERSLLTLQNAEFLKDVDFVKFSIVYTRSLALKDEMNSYALVINNDAITLKKNGTSVGMRLPNLKSATYNLTHSTVSSGTGTLFIDQWGTPVDDYSFTISSSNGLQKNVTVLGKTGYIEID